MLGKFGEHFRDRKSHLDFRDHYCSSVILPNGAGFAQGDALSSNQLCYHEGL